MNSGAVDEGLGVAVIFEVEVGLEVADDDLDELDAVFDMVSGVVIGEVEELCEEVDKMDEEVEEDTEEKVDEAIAPDSAREIGLSLLLPTSWCAIPIRLRVP